MTKRALVLFAHGARDPRWATPFRRLQEIIREQQPEVLVELAYLELMDPRLPELVGELARQGYDDLVVVPVFFGQGGHVLRDLPDMIAQLRAAHPHLNIKSAPAVGEDDAVLKAIAQCCVAALTQ